MLSFTSLYVLFPMPLSLKNTAQKLKDDMDACYDILAVQVAKAKKSKANKFGPKCIGTTIQWDWDAFLGCGTEAFGWDGNAVGDCRDSATWLGMQGCECEQVLVEFKCLNVFLNMHVYPAWFPFIESKLVQGKPVCACGIFCYAACLSFLGKKNMTLEKIWKTTFFKKNLHWLLFWFLGPWSAKPRRDSPSSLILQLPKLPPRSLESV